MTRDIGYLQYHSRYSSQNFKGTWHLTPKLAQFPKWTFELTGPNQIPAIYFYIFLNKNWKYLLVWTIKQSFTGLEQEDRCSSYSWGPPFSPYWYNFTRSDPAYFDRKHKSGLYSLHSFNQLIQIILIIFLLFLDKSPKLISATSSMLSMSFGPKLVGLPTSVGMIKLLFIIPTVNRNVLT